MAGDGMMLSSPAVPLKAGSALHVPDGMAAAKVRLFETTVFLIHRMDHDEHRRRAARGLGAIGALDLLDLLMDLPARSSVPLSALSSARLRTLRRAPDGVVEVDGRTLTRLLVPVITPMMAVVCTNNWDDALTKASRFASYCQRMVVVPELPDNEQEALSEADWYGIGVAVGPKAQPSVVVEPERFDDWTPTPAWWRFCERAYEQVLRSGKAGQG